MRSIRRSMAVTLAAVLVAACGGGNAPPQSAAQPRQFAASPPLDATALMDWAEGHYANFFPTHGTNQPAQVGPDLYTYRAYQVNGATNLLGVTADGRIDVLIPGVFDQPTTVGTLADYACRVLACPTVSGTAASGAPVAGALLTVQDSSARTVTTTTGADGTFSVRTDGLAPPFLLQVATAGGTRLYSVTADTQAVTVANVTPWTDLLVRNWYGAQATTPEIAFGSIATSPPPAPVQVQLAAQDLYAVAQLAIGAAGANLAQPLDLITKPFAADGTGIDRFLDGTRVSATPSGATVVLSMPTATETVAIGYDPTGHTVTMNATTSNAGATTTSSITSVMPTGTEAATALLDIQARLAQFAAVVNAKGTALTATDVQPFFTTEGIDDGLTMPQYVGEVASSLGQGQTMSFAIRQLQQFDATAGTALLAMRVQLSAGGLTDSEDMLLGMVRTGGTWLIAGDGRFAEIEVYAEARRNQGATNQSNGPDVNVDARPVLGTVSSVSVAGLGNYPVLQQPTEVRPDGVQLTPFVLNTLTLTGPLPVAGTPVTITLNKTAGGSVAYTLPLNAFTTELIRITSQLGTGIASAMLGSPLPVAWTLPTTFAVQRVKLTGQVFTGDPSQSSSFQCQVENTGVFGPASTSGTITLPTTCAGLPVTQANITVSVRGTNGERSIAIWFFQ